MARQKKSRYYPVQSRINLIQPTGVTSTAWIAVVPNLLSKLNRRHYPATGVYDVKVDLKPIGTDTSITVFALKDNWDTIGAVRAAFKAYQRATEDERKSMSKQSLPRWEDFRIEHGTGLPEVNPAVNDSLGITNGLTLGEFDSSSVVDAAGNTKVFSVAAPGSLTNYNILTQWSAGGNVDGSPSSPTATGMSYGDLESDAQAAQGTLLRTEGNLPPYDQFGNDGLQSPWNMVAVLGQGGSNTGTMTTGYFRAPLGMVLIISTDSPSNLLMSVREGSYKGIKVQNILE